MPARVALAAASRAASASSSVRTVRSWSASSSVGLVHEGALGGPEVDPALGVQPLQRLAHRLPGDAEVPGELALDEVLAGAERAGDDEFEQGLVDAVAQRSGASQPRHVHALRAFGEERHASSPKRSQ